MESTVKVKLDLSGLKEIERVCKVLSKRVEVGILHNAEEAKIGYLQHYGGEGTYSYGPFEGQSVRVPPRPFLSHTIESRGREILKSASENLYDFTVSGAERALDEVGEKCVSAVKDTISNHSRELSDVPNSRRTVLTKGHDIPLNDKGNLRDSIEYEVVQ